MRSERATPAGRYEQVRAVADAHRAHAKSLQRVVDMPAGGQPPARVAVALYGRRPGFGPPSAGERSYGPDGDLGRWVLPFFDELDAGTDPQLRGVGHLRFRAVQRSCTS